MGAWYAVFRGIMGVVCRENHIEINPHMMPWWNGVKMKFMYRQKTVEVSISDGKYTVTTESDDDITVVFRGETGNVSRYSPLVKIL